MTMQTPFQKMKLYNLKPVACTTAMFVGLAISGCAANNHAPTSHSSQEATDMTTDDERAARLHTLDQLASRLEAAYLFPDEGARYAAHLRSRGVTPAEATLAPEAFAARITQELQAIHPDGHLRLEVTAISTGRNQQGPHGPPPAPPPSNFAVHHAYGASYMRIDAMFGLDETIAQFDSFIGAAEPSDTIILDLRENRGGGLREMDFLFAELFAEPTDLVVMEVRRMIFEADGMPFGENAAMQPIEAPDGLIRLMHRAIPADAPRLAQNPVIILTSPTTGSAAEHLTMALQRTGRATVIGEASRGAAHFGGMLPTGSGFAAFIPAGRTFNPDTGRSWEGTGNQPDIAGESSQALMIALSNAGLSAEEARAFEDALP